MSNINWECYYDYTLVLETKGVISSEEGYELRTMLSTRPINSPNEVIAKARIDAIDRIGFIAWRTKRRLLGEK